VTAWSNAHASCLLPPQSSSLRLTPSARALARRNDHYAVSDCFYLAAMRHPWLICIRDRRLETRSVYVEHAIIERRHYHVSMGCSLGRPPSPRLVPTRISRLQCGGRSSNRSRRANHRGIGQSFRCSILGRYRGSWVDQYAQQTAVRYPDQHAGA